MNRSSSVKTQTVQESLEIYNELNRLGYDLIDYSNSLGDICDSQVDVWGTKQINQAIRSVDQPLLAVQNIIEGFKRLGGMSIDLLSPYGDIDFDFGDTPTEPNKTNDLLERYKNIIGGVDEKPPYPSTTQELLDRYQKLTGD